MRATGSGPSQQWLRGWAALALFAVLALFTSPAFAFNCCCQHISASQQNITHSLPTATTSASADEMPCCLKRVKAPSIQAISVVSHCQVNAKAPQNASIGGVCHCVQSDNQIVASFGSQNSFTFVPLLVSAPQKSFVLGVSAGQQVQLAFASTAARPRSPGAAYHTGRAPPAFSL